MEKRSFTISGKLTGCEFVGSFPGLDMIPRDNRAQIALAGRSNVGKSTLLNTLVGRKNMAKVSATPGKTRSLNFFLVNERFYLVDLPGYGYAKVAKSEHAKWGKMIEDYLTKSKHLAGLVLLLDCRRDPTDDDLELVEWLGKRQLPVMCVVTKTDKINKDQTNKKVRQIQMDFGVEAIPFSALKGTGKLELVSAVLNLVDEYSKR